MPNENLIKLKKETYLKMIENSEGTKLFNSLFVRDKLSGETYDIFLDGTYSGAAFVSGLLSFLGMIDHPHSTVQTTVENLQKFDFSEVNGEMMPGDILVYEVITFEDGTSSDQIGFYLNENTAFSTSYHEKKVIRHHPTFDETRAVVKVFRPEYGDNDIKFNNRKEA